MTWTRYLMVVALALIGPTACGGGEDASGERLLEIVARDPSHDTVELTAPKTIKAGLTEIVLTNNGDTLHDAQLFKVDGGHTGEDLVNELLEMADSAPKPKWAHPMGGVAALRPRQSRSVIQVLEPGRYLIADTQERPTAKTFKSTNAVKGGVAELEVTGDGGGSLPRPPGGATVTATDEGFEVDDVVYGANRTVRFENEGEEWHQAVFFRVPKGQTFKEAGQRLFDRRGDTGWVPVDVPAERATAVLGHDGAQLVDISLERGSYLIACFVSDRDGGPAHFATALSGIKVR